ncbi:MAG: inorganic diphosphatase [Patescibacteria group bacterium]|nr:inorganic diphosphatase [Patescibacteria group bacterium]
MNLYKDIPSSDNPSEEINVIVEIPKGSSNKYEYNEEEGYFELDRVLYSPLFFPFDYGFIPQTLSEDNDSLDVVLLTTYSTFPGCKIKTRPIGLLLMEDEKGVDNKIVAVPLEKIDPRFKEIKDIKDLPDHLKKEIQEFFETYKRLEPGKFVKIKGWQSKDKAKEIIKKAIARYKAQSK